MTLSNSGSHESNVSERTLEQWTPKLLIEKREKRIHITRRGEPFKCFHQYLITLFVNITIKKTQAESSYLWIPEHSMHSRIPRLMEAQQGALCPQSQHSSLPGRLCTLWSRLSPPPRAPLSALSPRSLSSLAESMLLVEGEAVRSRRCGDRQPRQEQRRRGWRQVCACWRVSSPRCNSCQWCLCKQRRCSPGPPVSTPVAASQTQPAACSSCRYKTSLEWHKATGCQRSCLTAHWRNLGRATLTLWGKPPRNRTSSRYPHRVWQNTISDPPPPRSGNPATAQLTVNIRHLRQRSCLPEICH